ncbi:tannase/feruloyl esterase family alpha/beta hydrolase [Amycolatopsis taiwanensis]|uniref:tannase/feruloyl esterase family alpha/beta hydrolase n=1 Tax=Amycolatopsis taiwanensis TaxID=342230 RepID=UPI0012EC5639|nr:tannase/feruloyl esterase family alpha/beta hydrolase [Amycolatopsis taiwanensis]
MRKRQPIRRPWSRAVTLVAAMIAVVVPALPMLTPPAVAGPVRTCGSLSRISRPDTTVVSAVEDSGDATTPPSCRVTLRITDPGDGGAVTVWVYLPLDTWNGRFQAVGGSGFLGGDAARLVGPLRAGYAAAATDAGHRGSNADFALKPDGSLNWPAIKDFGYQGIADMTAAAKAMVRDFYGKDAAYSYFNGCSTGGRQGITEAQRHPDDYDGILTGAPVIGYPKLKTGQMWGQVVMLAQGNPVAPCKFKAAVTAMTGACDTVGDGVRDGVIGDPLQCHFDLSNLVGRATPCGKITAADVEVMKKIQQGPRRANGEFLWYGLAPGASFAGLNDTVPLNGKLVGAPSISDLSWFSMFLAQNRSWDWTTLTYPKFEAYFDQAVSTYNDVLGADNPDLSGFARAGGKLLLWNGEADFAVPFQGTVDYYRRVQEKLGPGQTQQFLRLFLAPGVDHCGGGPGPQLADPLGALVDWVEHGKAPRTLPAVRTGADGSVTATRPVCMYPNVARWTGRGDPADGSTYHCVPARS